MFHSFVTKFRANYQGSNDYFIISTITIHIAELYFFIVKNNKYNMSHHLYDCACLVLVTTMMKRSSTTIEYYYCIVYWNALTFVQSHNTKYATTGNVLHSNHLLYDVTVIIAVMSAASKEIPFHISTPSDDSGNNKLHTSEQ